ncbi:unnamed protein product, partial [Heterotrigona itama]
ILNNVQVKNDIPITGNYLHYVQRCNYHFGSNENLRL